MAIVIKFLQFCTSGWGHFFHGVVHNFGRPLVSILLGESGDEARTIIYSIQVYMGHIKEWEVFGRVQYMHKYAPALPAPLNTSLCHYL